MKLVVDETLGRFQLENVVLKPVNTKKGPEPLSKVLENKKPKFTRNSLDITRYSQLDQIDYFKNLSEASQIVYFYDPVYTDVTILRRLQNWLYPEQSLHVYPIFHNRATLYMLLDKLSQTTLESASIIQTIEQYCSFTQEWIITPAPKAFYNAKKMFVHKKRKPKQFKLLTYENGRLRIKKSGNVTELMGNVVTDQDEDSHLWVVEKELSSDLPSSE